MNKSWNTLFFEKIPLWQLLPTKGLSEFFCSPTKFIAVSVSCLWGRAACSSCVQQGFSSPSSAWAARARPLEHSSSSSRWAWEPEMQLMHTHVGTLLLPTVWGPPRVCPGSLLTPWRDRLGVLHLLVHYTHPAFPHNHDALRKSFHIYPF